MYRKSVLTTLILIVAALAACSPAGIEETVTAINPNDGVLREVIEAGEADEELVLEQNSDDESPEVPVAEETVEEAVVEPDEDVEDVEDVIEDESADESLTPIDESLAKLPVLANSGGGFGGGGIGTESSLDVEGGVAGSIMIDPFNMFEQAEFVLSAEFPPTPTGLIAFERTRSTMTVELARQIASDFQFTGGLYQQQLAFQMMEDVEIGDDGMFTDMPFYAFDGNRQLVMMQGSIWISYGQVDSFDEPFPSPEDFSAEELIAQTEALLATYRFIDFEYTLRSEPYGSVLMIPIYEGVSANTPLMGFYYTLDQAKNPVLQSMYMDVYSRIDAVGGYPLLSAEAAWQTLKPGLENGSVNWFISGEQISIEPSPPITDYVEPKFWFPAQAVDTAVNLYGYPTVFNPVGQDGMPIILVDDTVIQGPAEIGMMLATSEEGLFKFAGQYFLNDVGGRTFAAQSVVPLSYEDQLFIQGVAVWEGDQLFVDSLDMGRVQLNNPPADL
ncbi:MAG: hypothetical protein ACI9EW_004211, partial [Cellvibrionaceae bacterium]